MSKGLKAEYHESCNPDVESARRICAAAECPWPGLAVAVVQAVDGIPLSTVIEPYLPPETSSPPSPTPSPLPQHPPPQSSQLPSQQQPPARPPPPPQEQQRQQQRQLEESPPPKSPPTHSLASPIPPPALRARAAAAAVALRRECSSRTAPRGGPLAAHCLALVSKVADVILRDPSKAQYRELLSTNPHVAPLFAERPAMELLFLGGFSRMSRGAALVALVLPTDALPMRAGSGPGSALEAVAQVVRAARALPPDSTAEDAAWLNAMSEAAAQAEPAPAPLIAPPAPLVQPPLTAPLSSPPALGPRPESPPGRLSPPLCSGDRSSPGPPGSVHLADRPTDENSAALVAAFGGTLAVNVRFINLSNGVESTAIVETTDPDAASRDQPSQDRWLRKIAAIQAEQKQLKLSDVVAFADIDFDSREVHQFLAFTKHRALKLFRDHEAFFRRVVSVALGLRRACIDLKSAERAVLDDPTLLELVAAGLEIAAPLQRLFALEVALNDMHWNIDDLCYNNENELVRNVISLVLDALATNELTSSARGYTASATTACDVDKVVAETSVEASFDAFETELARLCQALQESGGKLEAAEEARLRSAIDSELFVWETRGVRVRHAALLLLVQVRDLAVLLEDLDERSADFVRRMHKAVLKAECAAEVDLAVQLVMLEGVEQLPKHKTTLISTTGPAHPLPSCEGLEVQLDSSDLVDLDSFKCSTIILDARYATSDNFLGHAVYSAARIILQRPVALSLLAAAADLAWLGFGLLVFDGYRPFSINKAIWELTPEHLRAFCTNPEEGTAQNRGCAVDVSLYRLKDAVLGAGRGGRMPGVTMPSEFGDTTERAEPSFAGGSDRARKNRETLRMIMERHNFSIGAREWWHFDHAAWPNYPVLNVGFDHVPSVAPRVPMAQRCAPMLTVVAPAQNEASVAPALSMAQQVLPAEHQSMLTPQQLLPAASSCPVSQVQASMGSSVSMISPLSSDGVYQRSCNSVVSTVAPAKTLASNSTMSSLSSCRVSEYSGAQAEALSGTTSEAHESSIVRDVPRNSSDTCTSIPQFPGATNALINWLSDLDLEPENMMDFLKEVRSREIGANRPSDIADLKQFDPVTFQKVVEVLPRAKRMAFRQLVQKVIDGEAPSEIEDDSMPMLGYMNAAPLTHPHLNVGKEQENLISICEEATTASIRFRAVVGTIENLTELLRMKCTLLHFSGHGNANGNLLFETDNGDGSVNLVDASNLGGLLGCRIRRQNHSLQQ